MADKAGSKNLIAAWIKEGRVEGESYRGSGAAWEEAFLVF